MSASSERFSAALTAIVDEAGVTKKDIAQELGRSRAFVSDQLLGKRPVDTDVVTAISALLGGAGERFLLQQVLKRVAEMEAALVRAHVGADELAQKRPQRRPLAQPAKKAARTPRKKPGEK